MKRIRRFSLGLTLSLGLAVSIWMAVPLRRMAVAVVGVPVQNPAKVDNASAGTRTQLTSTITNANGVYIEADEDNTGKIYIGGSSVSSDRYITVLSAGEGWSWTRKDSQPQLDLTTLYIDSSASGDDVQFGYW